MLTIMDQSKKLYSNSLVSIKDLNLKLISTCLVTISTPRYLFVMTLMKMSGLSKNCQIICLINFINVQLQSLFLLLKS